MPLPINIEDLLRKQKIESNRIEFKKGWNPKAFAGQKIFEGQDVRQDVRQELNDLQSLIYKMISHNRNITINEIADEAKVSYKTIHRELKKMPMVKYVGSGYSGHWEILE